LLRLFAQSTRLQVRSITGWALLLEQFPFSTPQNLKVSVRYFREAFFHPMFFFAFIRSSRLDKGINKDEGFKKLRA
jgi:hypothetical protein